MILTGEAVKMVQNKYPTKRIISGLDMGEFYAFNLLDRSINPNSLLDLPTGSTMTAVRKRDGHEFLWHMYSDPSRGTFSGELNLAPYLSREDVEFNKNLLRMLDDV